MNHYKAPTSKTHGVMIDIETFAQTPDAVIASIAAVPFPYDVEEPLTWLGSVLESKSYFYKTIDLGTQPNRVFEGDSIKWWLKQEDAARQALLADGAMHLSPALTFLKETWPTGYPVYSKGATFDIVILCHAFTQMGIDPPWDYHQEFCARTVYELSGVGRPKIALLNGHNALDDALLQVVWFQRAWKSLLVPPQGEQ